MITPTFRKINLEAYKPGRSISKNDKKVIKLSANESALGIGKKVQKVLKTFDKKISKYPDSKFKGLTHLISKKYKLHFLSSGLLYRYASYLIIKYKPKKKIQFLRKKFKNLNYQHVACLNLHSQKINNYTTAIAKEKKVRSILRLFQKKFATKYKCESCIA